MRKFANSHSILFISMFLGIGTGFLNLKILIQIAKIISDLFLNYLSMISAPIVLFSILSTIIGVKFEHIRTLGKKVLLYTLLTTTLAAIVALGCFLILNPVATVQKIPETIAIHQQPYLQFLVEIVPSNILKTFLENKVISVAFLGILFGITTHFLEPEYRNTLQKGVSALFQLFLKIAGLIVYVMPIAVWAFMALLVREVHEQSTELRGLFTYLSVVALANLVQGIVIIPLLLKYKGISPWLVAKKGMRALLVAFFTKSSNATLPVTIKVAQEQLGIDSKIANFTLPLCTVINMNGCAAFILTTVLFVSGVNGHIFSPIDLAFWVLMAVIAAVGNAGVPMGCFFLSSAFLVSMDIPLTIMGLILPFYTLIDMEETALNVWSDLSVTAIIDRECKQKSALEAQILS